MQYDYAGKTRLANTLLDVYARAKLVITTRLHCALPCLALGTPVVFLHERYAEDRRFDGLREYLRGYGPDAQSADIDWENPRPTDISGIREQLSSRLSRSILAAVEAQARAARR
jgi:hypothetical protein